MGLRYIITAGVGVMTFLMIIWTIIVYVNCEKLDRDLTFTTFITITFIIITIIMSFNV